MFVVLETYLYMTDFVTSLNAAIGGFKTREDAETYIANGEKYHPGRTSSRILTKEEYEALTSQGKKTKRRNGTR